jgi:hypothetical protein
MPMRRLRLSLAVPHSLAHDPNPQDGRPTTRISQNNCSSCPNIGVLKSRHQQLTSRIPAVEGRQRDHVSRSRQVARNARRASSCRARIQPGCGTSDADIPQPGCETTTG